MNTPTHLKYAKTDEWLSVEGKIATIGVTDYAQDQLSDVVFCEVTVNVGEQVKKGTVFGTIESVKAAAEVNLPVGGKVIAVNENLSDKPEIINSDPFGEAWMVKIEMNNPGDVSDLLDAKAYEIHCKERSH